MADELDDATIAEIVSRADDITRANTATKIAREELEKAIVCDDRENSTASATRVTNAMANMTKAMEDEAEAVAQAEALGLSIQDNL